MLLFLLAEDLRLPVYSNINSYEVVKLPGDSWSLGLHAVNGCVEEVWGGRFEVEVLDVVVVLCDQSHV